MVLIFMARKVVRKRGAVSNGEGPRKPFRLSGLFKLFGSKPPATDPALSPEDVEASLSAAQICADQGDRDRAIALYSKVIELSPGRALAYYKRGNQLKDREQFEAALADYDRAIEIDPNYAYALCNRGVVLARLDRLEAALHSYDRAAAAAPNDALTFYNRASVLRELGRRRDAIASYDRAIAIAPGYLESHFNRGILLNELRRFPEALASLDAVLALKPDYAEAHLRRANVLENLKRYAEAIQALEQVFAYKPDFRFARGVIQHYKMMVCDWEEVNAGIEAIVAGIRRGEPVALPFAVLSLVDDVALHREGGRIWVQEETPPLPDLPPIVARDTPAKLRIGYFSADFFDHPVAMLTAQLFEIHDRSRFEIIAFSLEPTPPDSTRQRLEKAFDQFIDVQNQSDREVALLARRHEIDIAVDLSGHTGLNRAPKVFAHRVAPLQVGYLGYPASWGADFIDYLIGDSTVVPPEHRPHYSEKLVYLPHSFMPHDSTRDIDTTPTREQAGLPETGFVFCCFNNSYKFTPEVFASWMRILARVDGSWLWLSRNNATAASNLQREAERRGIDPRRLIFAQRTPSLPQHLARLRLADLFLDTLPYNAHATAVDALWSGLPILTRIGNSFAGRVAASLLRAIDVPELITTDAQQYEDLAVDLATNPTRLGEIKQRLASNRLSTPLFDSRSFARHLEDAYIKIHERYRAGLAPDHIHV